MNHGSNTTDGGAHGNKRVIMTIMRVTIAIGLLREVHLGSQTLWAHLREL